MTSFLQRLRTAQRDRESTLCVGLDPDPQRMPACVLSGRSRTEAVMHFNEAIIEATAPFACAYKLNFAFYEALGPGFYAALQHARQRIPPGIITIADAKRGDIGNTARQYAQTILGDLGFDACTVAPYMGRDAVAPFLAFTGKAAFILARTSNKSSRELQAARVGSEQLFHLVARHIAQWNHEMEGTAGLVVGATMPDALAQLRELCPALPFLIPGLGAQGGAARDLAVAASGPVIINSSRAILYASADEDFAQQAAENARTTRDLLAEYVPVLC